MVNGICEICGATGYVEIHHNIKRSQASYMRNIKINLVQLCMEHHRGNNSVHHNKKLDLKLKQQLQTRLQTMFSNEFYSREEIQTSLECNSEEMDLILKKLTLYSLGYNTEQLCRRLMGGRLF